MLQETTDNLDALIEEEKFRVAVEFFQDAWNSAVQEGIEAPILAESALQTVLTQLQSEQGEQFVASLLDSLPERLECGQFDANRCLQ